MRGWGEEEMEGAKGFDLEGWPDAAGSEPSLSLPKGLEEPLLCRSRASLEDESSDEDVSSMLW